MNGFELNINIVINLLILVIGMICIPLFMLRENRRQKELETLHGRISEKDKENEAHKEKTESRLDAIDKSMAAMQMSVKDDHHKLDSKIGDFRHEVKDEFHKIEITLNNMNAK